MIINLKLRNNNVEEGDVVISENTGLSYLIIKSEEKYTAVVLDRNELYDRKENTITDLLNSIFYDKNYQVIKSNRITVIAD